MPDTNAGQLTDNLLRRLRDPSATGLSRAFVRTLVSDCQRFVNGLRRRTFATVTLTTNPNQSFYPISAIANDVLRVEYIKEGSRNLTPTTLRELQQISTTWFRETHDLFGHFALPGRDMLVLYPAKKHASSVSVTYTKLTNAFVTDDVESEVVFDDLLEVLDLAQIIMLAKTRRFDLLEPMLKQFTTRHALVTANEQS